MITPSQIDRSLDLVTMSRSTNSVNNFKSINPLYEDKWYEHYNRFNDAPEFPLCTQARILEAYTSQRPNEKTGRLTEVLTLDLALSPIENSDVIDQGDYLEVKLWGPSYALNDRSKLVAGASPFFQSFVALMLYKKANAFDQCLQREMPWGEKRENYPNLWGVSTIVSFAATSIYNGRYGYSAFFFEPAPQQGGMPYSCTELNDARYHDPCDFVTLNEILKERYDAWAEKSSGTGYSPIKPSPTAASTAYKAPIDSATNSTGDEVPF